MTHMLLNSLLIGVVGTTMSVGAVADDLNAPEWRGQPLSLFAEWDWPVAIRNLYSILPDSDGGLPALAGRVASPGVTLVSAERSVTSEASVIADFGQFEDAFADDSGSSSGLGVFNETVEASAVVETTPPPFMMTHTTITSNITSSVIEASVSASVEWGGFDSGTSGNSRSASMIDVVFETEAAAAFSMNVTTDPLYSFVSLVNDVTGEEIFYVFDTTEVIEGILDTGRYRLQAVFDATEFISGDTDTAGSFSQDHYSFRFEIPSPSTMALFAVAGLAVKRRRPWQTPKGR